MTHVGELAPDFELPDSAGVMWRIADAPATVVYFTSNRCPDCFSWQPRLGDASRDYAGRGVRFIAVNVPCQFPGEVAARMPMRDGLEGVRAVADRVEWRGIPYLHGDTLAVARSYGARVVPDLFVIDADRIVRYRGAPDSGVFEPDKRAQWLRDALDAVLAGRRPSFIPQNLVGCPIKWRKPDDP